jgi:hypothetical protein
MRDNIGVMQLSVEVRTPTGTGFATPNKVVWRRSWLVCSGTYSELGARRESQELLTSLEFNIGRLRPPQSVLL